VTDRTVQRLGRDGTPDERRSDAIAVEEPLEIRVAGDPMVLTMRTPGDDADLAVGFLFAEGVIGSIDDVGTVAHCGRPGEEGFGNVIDVAPGPGVSLDPERLSTTRRGTLTTAACGVCGRRSIDDLLARAGTVPPGPVVPRAFVGESTERLRDVQPAFDRTGGLHAAVVLAADGAVLAAAEDVGRHNAVDKVIGALVRARRIGEPGPTILAVSGRVSFEIVQKAAVARIPIVAGVSAPTSLAVDLADRLGVTLAAFVRGGAFNVYAHPERIAR
jgi:FdhD protein